MNCPTCSAALVSVRMTKDSRGWPTFTFACSQHGTVGEKKFKRDFHANPESAIVGTTIRNWEHLIQVVVNTAWLFNVEGDLSYLRGRLGYNDVAIYFMCVRATMHDAQHLPRGSRSHDIIGLCGRCDGIRLYELGYRLGLGEWPELREGIAQRVLVVSIEAAGERLGEGCTAN